MYFDTDITKKNLLLYVYAIYVCMCVVLFNFILKLLDVYLIKYLNA